MTVPLSRNRNYRLLWSSQVLAGFGFNASTIAFPLLVLAVTGSAAASGLVLAATAAAQLFAGLPAGALVDRWNRKKVMLGCEAAQAVAAGSLVAALLAGMASVPQMVAVAALFGVCAALFEPAEEASLPNLVPAGQLPTAVAMNAARSYLGHLAGTAAGGFLFAVGRFVPFAVDALTHAAAFVTLAFLRVPRREVPPQPVGRLGQEIADGLRWVWRRRQLRVTALCAVVLNLFFSAFYVVVIVLARSRGVPAGQIGLMAAMLGGGGIVGTGIAPYLQRVLSPYLSVVGVFWVLTALTPLAAWVRNGYLMGALFAAMALLPPTANTTIMSRQLLLTPDGLRGRLSAVLGLVTGVAATVGPVLGGVLVEVVSGSQAVLLCTAGIAASTVLVTASPTLRAMPATPVPEDPVPAAAVPEDPVPAATAATENPVRAEDPVPAGAGAPVPAASQGHQPQRSREEIQMDDNARYEVLRNDEDQYSLWLAGHDVPAGWHRVGKEGTREECSAYVDEVWTDMRPRSLRAEMDGATRS